MLRLMTLNLNAYGERHGPWSERRPQIAAALRAARPDVVALQAVAVDPTIDEGHDQATQLARDIGDTSVVYHTAARHPDGREDGIAILSRRPPIDIRAHRLSRRGDGDDPFTRVLLRATFSGPQGPLHVVSAHFSWIAEQADDNVGEALQHLAELDGAVALAGDFNHTPESEPLARLRAAGFTDAWAAMNETAPGFTFYERGALAKRIDYVLVSDELAPRICAARLVLDDPGPLRASDHAGLVVDLSEHG